MNVKNVQHQTSHPIICIPRVKGTITKMQVASVFKRLDWGKINNIVIVTSETGKIKSSGKRSTKWGFNEHNNGSSSDTQWRKTNNKIENSGNNTTEAINCIFVYLNWYNNDKANYIKETLLDKQSIKLVCNEFDFWKLYAKNETIK
tara:strand:+ start:344 stop:781 length:438 start_codon:yes stop_codon:yes gene_type:complete